MASHNHSEAGSQRHRLEGPRNHNLTYLVSIVLTVLSFCVVAYGELDRAFVFLFLTALALIQGVFQLAYWMHMKDKGHLFAVCGIIFGFIIALTVVAAAVWMMWW